MARPNDSFPRRVEWTHRRGMIQVRSTSQTPTLEFRSGCRACGAHAAQSDGTSGASASDPLDQRISTPSFASRSHAVRQFRSVTAYWDPARNRDHERSSLRHISGEVLRPGQTNRPHVTRPLMVFCSGVNDAMIGRSIWAVTSGPTAALTRVYGGLILGIRMTRG